jgi:hypothetical protein
MAQNTMDQPYTTTHQDWRNEMTRNGKQTDLGKKAET